jgi:hypothetical protein
MCWVVCYAILRLYIMLRWRYLFILQVLIALQTVSWVFYFYLKDVSELPHMNK